MKLFWISKSNILPNFFPNFCTIFCPIFTQCVCQLFGTIIFSDFGITEQKNGRKPSNRKEVSSHIYRDRYEAQRSCIWVHFGWKIAHLGVHETFIYVQLPLNTLEFKYTIFSIHITLQQVISKIRALTIQKSKYLSTKNCSNVDQFSCH